MTGRCDTSGSSRGDQSDGSCVALCQYEALSKMLMNQIEMIMNTTRFKFILQNIADEGSGKRGKDY